MNEPYDILLQSLAKTITDYRENELFPITPAHVEKWLKQFDVEDQPIILAEVASIMKRFYFSKAHIKAHIRHFLKDTLIGSQDPGKLLPHVSFLRIQQVGSSQEAMLDLVDEILQEEYGLTITMTGTEDIQAYIYIDDAIYTGNRLRYDLTDGSSTVGWFSNCSASNCTLIIYTVAAHKEGLAYVSNMLRLPAQKRRISIQFSSSLLIENARSIGKSIEVLWPQKGLADPIVESYVANLYTPAGRKIEANERFRSNTDIGAEKLFSSPDNRRVVENAFLSKGIQLVKASQNPAPSIRPLGFMKLISLGFGTFFVTYRNISNNCPLVLWWGDPSYPSTHPLGKWYPLFPRRTNISRAIITEEQIFNELPLRGEER